MTISYPFIITMYPEIGFEKFVDYGVALTNLPSSSIITYGYEVISILNQFKFFTLLIKSLEDLF
jgi:hypothetical protein